GQPGRAAISHRRGVAIVEKANNAQNLAVHLTNLSIALGQTGALHAAEANVFRAFGLVRDEIILSCQVCLNEIGALRATRGAPDCDAPLGQSLRMFDAPRFSQAKGVALSLLAQSSLWRGEADAAGRLADAAWELAGVGQLERDFARAARLQGQAALGT